MHVIEKRWKALEAGYKKLNSLTAQLDSQWRRPLQVVQRQKLKHEYTAWKNNRQILILFFGGFFLGGTFLCGLTYFAEEWNMQCLYSFLAFILVVIGIAFAILRRRYILSIFNQPVLEKFTPPSQRLTDLWWKNLVPRPKATRNSGDEGVDVFLDLLEYNLPDSYIAVPEILTSIKKATDTDVLLLGPTGIWVFEVKHWYGTIHKMDGIWWHVVSNRRIDHLHETGEQRQGPDEQWLNQVREIKETLRRRRPELSWLSNNIHGGIVFSNPDAQLEKNNIRGNTVPYGRPRPWLTRIQSAKTVQNFTLSDQFRVLDALIDYGLSIERDKINPVSSIKLADRAHKKVTQEMTEHVERWVK